jgi:hypothetical protein
MDILLYDNGGFIMAILGSTDRGRGRYQLTVDHNPSVVATDGLQGSLANNITDDTEWYKEDDGETTNWTQLNTAPATTVINTYTGLLAGVGDLEDVLVILDALNVYTCETVSTSGATWTTLATYAMTDDTVIHFTADVVGRRTDSPDRAGYSRRGVFYREGGAGAMQQGTTDTFFTEERAGPWNCRLSVSGNNVLVEVKGDTGESVNWKACYKVTEVS